MSGPRRENICVVVLGDIGRSPRMQYHAASLANTGYNVNIIGYKETKIYSSLVQHSNVRIHPLVPYPNIPYLPRFCNYVFKTVWQTFTLLCALFFKKADYVLAQNPPAIPTLYVCWIYSFFARAKFVIDWHNYAYTIMALNVGKDNVLVKMTKFVESYIGRKATSNLCVTKAMKNDLKVKWNIDAVVLYDKPPRIFRPISLEEKHFFLQRLAKQYPAFGDSIEPNNTVFTKMNDNDEVTLREDRPGFIVSSTSWTPDEDFSILLTLLSSYDEACQKENTHKLPKLICVITGKGPMKDYYLKLIERANMKYVTVITPWLEASDYPLLLASADLGVCLHTSSSGLDLPMKVVDMFGCCLPVCAFYYNCIHELVKHKENSYVFKNYKDLYDQVISWFADFPTSKDRINAEEKFKKELQKFQSTRWEENWTENALPLFK